MKDGSTFSIGEIVELTRLRDEIHDRVGAMDERIDKITISYDATFLPALYTTTLEMCERLSRMLDLLSPYDPSMVKDEPKEEGKGR